MEAKKENKLHCFCLTCSVNWGFVLFMTAFDSGIDFQGILEALEFLLSNGFQPRRSFYVAFGHDEEVREIVLSRSVVFAAILPMCGCLFDLCTGSHLCYICSVYGTASHLDV